jgi:hypothetical protein
VLATALNQRVWAKHLNHRLVQCLGSVDHDYHRTVGIQSALNQIGEQGPHPRSILGRALAQSQYVLGPALINAHRRQYHMLGEVHAIDQQRYQGEAAQFAAHQFRQFTLGAVDVVFPPAGMPMTVRHEGAERRPKMGT